jgi:membrane-bound lytic murein transglycosylase F
VSLVCCGVTMRDTRSYWGAFALLLVAGLAVFAHRSDRQRSPQVASGVYAAWPTFTTHRAEQADVLADVRRVGQLRVATRNAPTTYYVGSQGELGVEFELAKAFADYLGVTLDIHVYDDVAAMQMAVSQGEVHLAAPGLPREGVTLSPALVFGPDYQEVQREIVCRAQQPLNPDALSDLAQRELVVEANGGYEAALQDLAQYIPGFRWSAQDLSTDQILEGVAEGELDCALVDSHALQNARRYDDRLASSFAIADKLHLAWVVARADAAFQDTLADWLATWRKQGRLTALLDRYYGELPQSSFADLQAFQKRIENRLPKYRREFERAAGQSTIPWTVLAALAYQESHWDPAAVSPTGVRGIMMLTSPTADALGVNRMDPKQSIHGGARYLAQLLERVPVAVRGQDRLWFALAAYNVGLGHVYDAQHLARRLGKNANVWGDVRTVLPLLAKKAYYRNTKYGYARGKEPVHFVDRIRNYLHVLDDYLAKNDQLPPHFDPELSHVKGQLLPTLARVDDATLTVVD